MSVDANYLANAQRLVCQALANTTKIKIGNAASNNNEVLAGLWLANAGSTVTTNVYWYNSATTTEYLIWTGSVTAATTIGGPISTVPLPIVMREGDEIRVAGTASMTVTLLYVMLLTNGR